MIISAVIAEYNPFHNGHKYQIDYLRNALHSDFVVVIMSGNYVQRGAPAMFDKYVRTEAALRCGADIVLELPLIYATGSAEYFAEGAVTILERLGFINQLCFGAETPDLPLLLEIASLLAEEPDSYLAHLKNGLRLGLSYPGSRQQALLSLFERSRHGDIRQVLSSPNNILAIEYLKALKKQESSILPVPLLRAGSEFHDRKLPLCHTYASASAVREVLGRGKPTIEIEPFVPGPAYEIYQRTLANYAPVVPDDFSEYFYERLLFSTKEDLLATPDINQDLADRIWKLKDSFQSMTQFSALIKTRQLTLTRVQRALLHILLHQSRSDYPQIPYVRVLGLKKAAGPVLKQVPDQPAHAKAPLTLITKAADASSLLEKEVLQNNLYNRTIQKKSGYVITDDFRHRLVLLP